VVEFHAAFEQKKEGKRAANAARRRRNKEKVESEA